MPTHNTKWYRSTMTGGSPDDGGYAVLGVEYGPWLVVMHGIDDESPLVFDRVYGSPMLF